MTETIISFVRHGEVHNPKKIFYGRLPRFGLSDLGREQAVIAGDYLDSSLPPVARIFTSPLLRTRQTAELVKERLNSPVPIQKTKLLLEVHTPHDGRPLAEMEARNWDLYTGIGQEYEQPEDIVQRTRRWVARIRRDFSGQHIVGVTHGDVVMYQLLWALNRPLSLESKLEVAQAYFGSDYLHTASISTFTFRTTDIDERPDFRYFGR